MTDTDGVTGAPQDTPDQAGWFSDEAATLGDRLAGAREAAGLHQKELAARLGVKHATLRKWEDDLAEPRANRLQMLAGMLGVSLSWLLTGTGDGPEAPDERSEIPDSLRRLLDDIRAEQARLSKSAARLGQLEKKLRRSLQDMA